MPARTLRMTFSQIAAFEAGCVTSMADRTRFPRFKRSLWHPTQYSLTKACCREVEGGVLLDCPNPGVAHATRIATERSHAFNRSLLSFNGYTATEGYTTTKIRFLMFALGRRASQARDCQTLSQNRGQ